MPETPGGQLAKRPLQFIWLVDCSGSMCGRKIESLNLAIREAIKPMQDVADENPNAEVFVRVVRFSDGAQWHVSQPTEVHGFCWNDLDADGVTDMGKALTMLAEALRMENMPARGLPPVLVLISDGQPTDNYSEGLRLLMDQPWGKKSVRIAVAIGEDADMDVLQKFIGNVEVKPLKANNVQDLVKKIKWASTVPLKAASNPASRTASESEASGSANICIPAPPSDAEPQTAADVF
jgi:uncharacterized protein YegL